MSKKLNQHKTGKHGETLRKKSVVSGQGRNVLQELGISDGAIIDNINDGVYILDDKGYFVYVNKVIEQRSGIPIQDFVRLHFLDIVAAKDHERVQGNFERVMKGEQVSPYELEYVRPDGSLLSVEVNTRPIFKDGRVAALLGISRDIGRRKQAEKLLRESEERLRFLSGVALEALAVHHEGTLVEGNEQYFKMFGYEPHELLGTQMIPLTIASESIPFVKKQISQGITTPYEATGLRKDGAKFPIEICARQMEYRGRKVRVAVIRDLTDRRRAEEVLRESEARLRTAMESLPFDFFVINEDGRYVMQNQTCKRHWGEVIGKRPEDLNVSEDTLRLWQNNNRRAFAGEVVKEEVRFQRSGDEGYYYNIISPIHADGEIRGILGINIDITERKVAEEAIKKARDELEKRVAERTVELSNANKELRDEIVERSRAEEAVREREAALEMQTKELEEVNSALRVLLRRRDKDKTELEEKVLSNVKELVQPYIDKLKKTPLDGKQMTYVKILESNLNDIVSPFVHQLSSKYSILTPTEIQVAQLIKEGKTTKEIAELLGSSKRTVESHRENIRIKLGLKHQKVNLRSFLSSM